MQNRTKATAHFVGKNVQLFIGMVTKIHHELGALLSPSASTFAPSFRDARNSSIKPWLQIGTDKIQGDPYPDDSKPPLYGEHII